MVQFEDSDHELYMSVQTYSALNNDYEVAVDLEGGYLKAQVSGVEGGGMLESWRREEQTDLSDVEVSAIEDKLDDLTTKIPYPEPIKSVDRIRLEYEQGEQSVLKIFSSGYDPQRDDFMEAHGFVNSLLDKIDDDAFEVDRGADEMIESAKARYS